jgi:pantoate--beta-alanine ligase
MYLIKKIDILHKKIKWLKMQKHTIGLVPTMGNLHNGHMKLIASSKKYTTITVVTIFVNPMQFNNLLDFKTYPKTFEQDFNMLKNLGVNILFFPNFIEMYPNNMKNHTFIDVPKFSKIIEGKSRPGHFKGVATIVSKLFNIIQPDYAFFGEKDYQQLLIVKTLIKELNYMIKIISLPTVRLKNGLALSSRNNRLTDQEKKIAPNLYYIIQQTSDKIKKIGLHDKENIVYIAKQFLIKQGFFIDIFDIFDYKTLHIASKKNKKIIILASVWLGSTRLIDNKIIFLQN